MMTDKRNRRARPIDLPMFDSMAHMAVATGIPESILSLAKKNGCGFVRHGRCDLKTFCTWWFEQNLSAEEREDWSKRNVKAQALQREHDLAKDQRSVMPTPEVDQVLGSLVTDLFFHELDRIAQEFPASLKGKTEIEVRDEVNAQIETVKRNLEARYKAWEEVE